MRDFPFIAFFPFPITIMAQAPVTEADKLKQAAEHGIAERVNDFDTPRFGI